MKNEKSMAMLFVPLLLLLSVPVWAEAPRFEATDTDGKTVTGRLTALSVEGATFHTNAGEVVLEKDRLLRLRNLEPFDAALLTGPEPTQPAVPSPMVPSPMVPSPNSRAIPGSGGRRGDRFPDASEPYRRPDQLLPPLVTTVVLTDGGMLVAEKFGADMKSFTIERSGDSGPLTFPLPELALVRFNVKSADVLAAANTDAAGNAAGIGPVSDLPEEWTRLLRSVARGDRLVVQKGDGLDTFTGIVREVDEKTVRFESDGEVLPVPREKVAGLLYYQAAPPLRTETLAVLRERFGSRVPIADFLLETPGKEPNGKHDEPGEISLASTLRWVGTGGANASTTLNMLAELEFPQFHLVPLARLVPAGVERKSSYGWSDGAGGANGPLALFERLTWPKVAESEPVDPMANALAAPVPESESDGFLNGAVFRDTITLAAKTELKYDLAEPFTRLRGMAGIDDRSRPEGKGRLTIHGDATLLFDRVLRGDEPAVPLDLPLDGIKRLTLTVDFPDGVDAGCRVSLGGVKLHREKTR